MLSACWSSALIVEDKVYIGSEDGDIFIFKLSPKLELISKKEGGEPGGISMGSAVYSTPISLLTAQRAVHLQQETTCSPSPPTAAADLFMCRWGGCDDYAWVVSGLRYPASIAPNRGAQERLEGVPYGIGSTRARGVFSPFGCKYSAARSVTLGKA